MSAWAVGEDGTIPRFDGTAWTKEASPLPVNLSRVWESDRVVPLFLDEARRASGRRSLLEVGSQNFFFIRGHSLKVLSVGPVLTSLGNAVLRLYAQEDWERRAPVVVTPPIEPES